jgi:hypothetical protein
MKASDRWLNWQSRGDTAGELTKPTKPPQGEPYLLEKPQTPTDKTDKTSSADGFVSFVSPPPRLFQKIRTPPAGSPETPKGELTKPTKPSAEETPPEVEPSAADLASATALLNQAGVRLMHLEAGAAIGVWSDLDSQAIRAALLRLGMGHMSVLYLDGPGVPDQYKLRRIPGDPVPNPVREAMEKSREPWRIRSRMVCNFVPWPLPETKSYTIDPQTSIRPPCEWGSSCGRGFVSNARPRKRTRKWRQLND